MKRLYCLAAGVLFAFAGASAPQPENVWSFSGVSSLSFEFRFLNSKGQVVLTRSCEEKKPRTRIRSTLSMLPHCFRSNVWDADRGRSVWRGNQMSVGSFGCGKSFKECEWYKARVVARHDSTALLVHWNGVWREVAFTRYGWGTTEMSLSVMPGLSEVRNVKEARSSGRARWKEISPVSQDVFAEFATGFGQALIKIDYTDGTERWMYLWPDAETLHCTRRTKSGADEWYPRVCRDGLLRVSDPSLKIFSAPRVWAHRPSDRAAAIDYIDSHPEATAPRRRVKFRFAADRTVWLDGKYIGATTNDIRRVALYVPETAPKGERLYAASPVRIRDVIKLDPADCCGVKYSDDRKGYLDISEHKEHSDPGQETDHYQDRDGFDGFKDSFVWSIPNECWQKARIVAGVSPFAGEKSAPIVTVRLARNGFAGYGNACAEGQINLDTFPRKAAGTAIVGGRKIKLYAYEVKIPVGDIQDRLYVKRGKTKLGAQPYLHVDIVGPLGRPGILWDRSHKPDSNIKSSALVFGIELEKAACEMELEQSVPGLVFADREKRVTPLRLKANKAGEYKISAVIRDWDGNGVKIQNERLKLAAGEERRIMLDLAAGAEGWYSLKVTLSSEDQELITHNASFADVGRDIRKAGYESPFSFWWFGAHHGGTADIEKMGPILKKMGVRRISAIDGQHTEKSMAEYGLTLSQIPFNINLAASGLSKRPVSEVVEEYEEWIRGVLARFPNVERRIIIYHESYCGGYPYYLWGGNDRVWKDADFSRAKQWYTVGVALCRMIRAKFPGFKIQLGNSSTSYEIADIMFRQKFPKELFDYVGSETVARFVMPDSPSPDSGPSSLVYLNQVADHYGYPQRSNVCYEWVSHLPRELKPSEGAEWGVRDALLAFAAGATMVPVGGTTPDDSYFNSDYGGVSSVDRYPYLYPSRGYFAAAVMTRELDQSVFTRRLPTGSQTVNALEFRRKDGSYVYAMWLPRGNAAIRLVGADDGKELRPDRAVCIDGQHLKELRISTRPVFAATRKIAQRAQILARDNTSGVVPENFQLASSLSDASSVRMASEGSAFNKYLLTGKYRTNGVFAVSNGDGCIAVRRDSSVKVHKNKREFVFLELAKPVVMKGKPASLSIEVDGNSSWADVFFFVEDAEGKLFTPTRVWYEGDGRANGSVNFDGWGTLQFPFSRESRVKTSEVDARGGFWQYDARGRKTSSKEIVYPVKVVGFGVAMPRNTISGGVFEPVAKNPDVLRFRNIGMFE